MDIIAPTISLADRPQRAICATRFRQRREDRTSISSHTLADLGGKPSYQTAVRRRSGPGTGLKAATVGQNAPRDPGELVGQGDRQHVAMQPFPGGLDPGPK